MTGLYLRLRKLATSYLKMGSVTVNEISTDGTMAGNSDSALPTEKAVKTYIDTKALEGNEVKDDPAPELSANLDTAGFSITDSVDGMIKLNGGMRVYNLVDMKSTSGTSGVLDGATGTITLNVPVGAWVIGYTMNNDAAIVDDDGDDTYTAAFSGGLVAQINSGDAIAAAKNTKIATMGGMGITSAPLSVTLTPNGTNFTGGEVSITVVYMTINVLPDVE